MKFQNFYTSIFNKEIVPKAYVSNFLTTLVFIFFISFVLNISNVTLTGNDLIKEYQLGKIQNKDFLEVATIFVGDSSCGNAIDAKYFSELSKEKSVNLSLTGSWGVVGSLGIIKKAIKSNPKIKNIIIMQTPDIWRRPFSKEPILELYSTKEIFENLDLTTISSYYFNPKEIWWHLKSLYSKQNISEKIDTTNDYIQQKQKKYSNGKKTFHKNESLNYIKINKTKKRELSMLEDFCTQNSLHCIFLKGPTHTGLTENSTEYLQNIDTLFVNTEAITYDKTNFSYDNSCIGDSIDHIDTVCKKLSTQKYFSTIKEHLK